MTLNGNGSAPPETMRRLADPAALALAELVEVFDDLQTVLRCCERLVEELEGDGETDEVVVEAVWTTALLSYGRCFTATGEGVALSEDDVRTTHTNGDEVVKWHRLLRSLRDHYADPAVNPRERFSVGVTQAEDGSASGVGITSARQPLVDELTVRQTGAIALRPERHRERADRIASAAGLRGVEEQIQGVPGQPRGPRGRHRRLLIGAAAAGTRVRRPC